MKPDVKPFDFLTPDRENAFRQAIVSTNKHHNQHDREVLHIFDGMPGQEKARTTRGWFLGYLKDKLSFDENALPRSFNGVVGYMFDEKYFVHFRSLDDPEQPIWESKTIRSAKNLQRVKGLVSVASIPQQMELFPEDPEEKPLQSLEELYMICGGYIREEGYMVEFHFLDQRGDQIVDSLELNINNHQRNVVEQEIPATQFIVKNKGAKDGTK